jgi:CubicO group peptidase (beta-lactamase class C family)
VRLPYSEGREFISIAAVLMEQEGLLSLEDKVRKYFPKLPAWAEPVSIWDLLNHRSGFADEWDAVLLTQASMGNRFDVSQFLNLLYTQPKEEVVPGKGYMYSNSDFGLLRLLLEKASGENLSDWMKQKMFDPIGMKATLLHDNVNEVIPNYALKYSPVANRKFSSITNEKTSPGGNYYIATTANDLERWGAVHAEKKSEISKAAKRLMNNAQLMPGAGKNFVFGYKLRNDNGQHDCFTPGSKQLHLHVKNSGKEPGNYCIRKSYYGIRELPQKHQANCFKNTRCYNIYQ